MNNEQVKSHFNGIAADYDYWKKKNKYYYSQLIEFYTSVIPKDKDVLEIGCGTGDVLKSVLPRFGVGIDISEKMVEIARGKNPHLSFVSGKVEDISFERKFDYIIMADIVEHLSDIWVVLAAARKLLKENGEVIITMVNANWWPILFLAEKMRLKMPEGPINFVFPADIANMAKSVDFQIKGKGFRLFLPVDIPLLSKIINRAMPKVPFLKNLCLTQYLVLKTSEKEAEEKKLSCSVIIPCHNEAGNIEKCVKSIPKIGKSTEIIVVDDGSTDDTKKIAEKLKGEMGIRLISHFPNKGKGFAVKAGFSAATGDVLIIMDADMAVPAEELPRFFTPLSRGTAQFANGTRMIYPVEKQAMSYLHLLGNKFFSFILSWLMSQRVTDTLCGTKALFKRDFPGKIRMEHCPWGDFDLLFGAAKAGMKIVEIPVHYKMREADKSKMRTFKHGFLLLCMCFRGFNELKLAKLAFWRSKEQA